LHADFSVHAFLVHSFAVFVMLGILSVLIIVHECGHFSVARFFGFQTPVFGFGLPFGPHWVVGKKWGTEFRVHAALLGGYVAIPELGDESNQDAFGMPLQPFHKFPIWQRALVAIAGVTSNVIFAYLIMLVMFFALGEPTNPTAVDKLMPDPGIALRAGVQEGDEVIAIDHVKVDSPTDAVQLLGKHKAESVLIDFKRNGQPIQITVTTNADGKVGMALVPKGTVYRKVQGNPFEVAGAAWNKLWSLTASMVEMIGQLFHNIATGGGHKAGQPGASISDLHGVLAVIKIGSDIAAQDWNQLLLFTVLISMDLALVNLLPWPALDGGHLAFMAFEKLRGKPMEETHQSEIVKWGFISLIVLMAVIMVNDVTALFTGQLDLKHDSKDKTQQGTPKAPEAPTAPAATPSPSQP
jgi:membrane-associated protease RseP (regulator of RpoE activity)